MKKKHDVAPKGGIDPADYDDDSNSEYQIETDEDEQSIEENESSFEKDGSDELPADNESDQELLADKDVSDDSPYDDKDNSQDDGTRHNKRGPARGKRQIQKWKHQPGRVEVMYNKLGMPIGDPANDISTLCGVLARSTIPITYNNWRAVPNELKERIWETITVSFHLCTLIKKLVKFSKYNIFPIQFQYILHPRSKDQILQSVGQAFRNFKYRLRKKYITPYLHNRKLLYTPPTDQYTAITKEVWKNFVNARLTKAFKVCFFFTCYMFLTSNSPKICHHYSSNNTIFIKLAAAAAVQAIQQEGLLVTAEISHKSFKSSITN